MHSSQHSINYGYSQQSVHIQSVNLVNQPEYRTTRCTVVSKQYILYNKITSEQYTQCVSSTQHSAHHQNVNCVRKNCIGNFLYLLINYCSFKHANMQQILSSFKTKYSLHVFKLMPYIMRYYYSQLHRLLLLSLIRICNFCVYGKH